MLKSLKQSRIIDGVYVEWNVESIESLDEIDIVTARVRDGDREQLVRRGEVDDPAGGF